MDRQAANNVNDFQGPLSTANDVTQRPSIYRVNHDYSFSPNLHLHTTFGYSATDQQFALVAQRGFGSKFGFPGLTGVADATPVIRFAGVDGYTTWGSRANFGGQRNRTPHATQSLTLLRGHHEFKTGWDWRGPTTYNRDLAGSSGVYTFARAQNANPTATGTTGNSFASFLLGAPDAR